MNLASHGKSLKVKSLNHNNLKKILGNIPKIFFNLLLCLFYLFLLHPLVVTSMYYILQFHLLIIPYFFDSFLLLLLFLTQIFRSNPPVLNPSVFKSSCATNTYVLMLPCFIKGNPASPPQAALPNLLSKCT